MMLRVTSQEFQEWRSSLITKLFFEYLISRADDEGEFIKADFFAGALPIADMNTLTYTAGQARAFQEIGEITYEDIEEYYAKEIGSDTDNSSEV